MQVSFTLWEDDAKGAGHHPAINALNRINSIPLHGSIDLNGIAEAVFRLPAYTMAVHIANARTAAGDRSEGALHEYYVTADVVSASVEKASPNINVINPAYMPPPPRQRNWLVTVPVSLPRADKPKPAPDSPKFPVTVGGRSQGDSQGKILSAEFVDTGGNRLHASRAGAAVILKIMARGMENKKVRVKIWEEDNLTWTNDLLYERDWILTGDENYIGVQLTGKMFDKAKDGGSDSHRQDYFIEVLYAETAVTSAVMAVTQDAMPTPVVKGKSVSVVEVIREEKKEEGRCPRCDKPVTPADLKTIFPQATDEKLKIVAETYTKYMKDLQMNTCWNKAHFFAQAKIESGDALSLKEGENFNYYWEALIIEFKAFQTPEGREKAKIWGRAIKNRKDPKAIDVPKEIQIKIANYAYSPPVVKAKVLGNTDSNDGWNYRGRGLIQVTGKSFYKYCNQYTIKNNNIDVIINPNAIEERLDLAVSSGMIFFKWKGINKKANNSKDVKGKICPLVGKNVSKTISKGIKSSNYDEKQKVFNEITSVIFKIDSCTYDKINNRFIKGKYSTYDSKYNADNFTTYIDVIVPKDRKKEGLLVFFDNAEILHKCYVLGLGTGGEDRYTNGGYGNVPNGLWNTKQELNIPNLKGQAYPNSGVSFGNHGTIRLSPKAGDALNASKRSGILLHSGHTMGDGKKGLSDNGPLMVTHGCLRVYNKDMSIIQKKYSEQIAKGRKVYIYVEETNNLNNMFDFYGTTADPKDTVIRKNKKYDAQ